MREHERRTNLEYVSVVTGCRYQHSPFPQSVHDRRSEGCIRLPGIPVLDKLNADVETGAADVSNLLMTKGAPPHAFLNDVPHLLRILQEILVTDHVERRLRRGDCDCIAAERV